MQAGLAPPRFEEVALRFRVTLFTTPLSAPVTREKDTAIMAALADDAERSTGQIAEAIGLTPRATRTRLARLVEQGLAREIGSGPQDPRRRYVRVPT